MAKFWNFIKNAATETEPETVDLHIEGDMIDDKDVWLYQFLGMPCTSPNVFKQELSQYKGIPVNVVINSDGGSVFAGIGIFNALMEHKKAAKVTARVDARAASAATLPMMAAKPVGVSPAALTVIHNPIGGQYGDYRDMQHMADILLSVRDAIIGAYQTKTNLSHNKLASMMDDETWMSAKVAVKNGFADEILYSEKPEEILNSFSVDFSRKKVEDFANHDMARLLAIEKDKSIEAQNELEKQKLLLEIDLA